MGSYDAGYTGLPRPHSLRPVSLLAVLALMVWAVLLYMPWDRATRASVRALRPISGTRCAQPGPEDIEICRALEQEILESTVRFQVVWWIPVPDQDRFDDLRRIGHGTVLPGCRLLTHNHFDVALPPFNPPDVHTSFYFYDAAGSFIGRSTQVTIAEAGQETLVLTLVTAENECPLGKLANHPARFASQPSSLAARATEAAQVDWDGTRSYVSWKPIAAVDSVEGVDRLVLDGPVMLGASGGGVYVHGHYVATTWTRVTYRIASTLEVVPGGESWAVTYNHRLMR